MAQWSDHEINAYLAQFAYTARNHNDDDDDIDDDHDLEKQATFVESPHYSSSQLQPAKPTKHNVSLDVDDFDLILNNYNTRTMMINLDLELDYDDVHDDGDDDDDDDADEAQFLIAESGKPAKRAKHNASFELDEEPDDFDLHLDRIMAIPFDLTNFNFDLDNDDDHDKDSDNDDDDHDHDDHDDNDDGDYDDDGGDADGDDSDEGDDDGDDDALVAPIDSSSPSGRALTSSGIKKRGSVCCVM